MSIPLPQRVVPPDSDDTSQMDLKPLMNPKNSAIRGSNLFCVLDVLFFSSHSSLNLNLFPG